EGLSALCVEDPDFGFQAVLYADLHVDMDTGRMEKRPDTINIACVSGGVGKAATWGYTTWGVGVEVFEAAVRVVRDDFCGDGRSWTEPGTPVSAEDWLGINVHGQALGGPNEAIWGPHGALC